MTGPPTQGSGVDVQATKELPRYEWLTADRQAQVRNILLGLALFAGLVVYVYHSFGPQPRAVALAHKLRIVGVMTWLYALVQIVDMRFWHSSIRRAASRLVGNSRERDRVAVRADARLLRDRVLRPHRGRALVRGRTRPAAGDVRRLPDPA